MKKLSENKNSRKVLAVAAAAVTAAAIGLSACSAQAQSPGTIVVQNQDVSANQLTVSGKEEVRVVPDMAEIVFSIRTQKPTAQECQQENAKNLNDTIEKLKSLGVDERSIQTSAYGLDPIYNWNSDTREITGYEMNTQLTVSDIPIDEAGSIMSQSVVAGVNSIDNVSYFCSTYDESYQEALKKAIEMAKGKASAMAEASGRTLGEVSNVEEYGYNPYARYTGYMSGGSARNEMAMETAAAAMDMGVMAGEISVEAQVSVTFNLQ